MKEDYGFINGSELSFSDISSELKRKYTFPNGHTLTIKEPLVLNVSASGGHRVYNKKGVSYYVQPKEGWFIKWTSKKDAPNIVL
jgi:hypothetical protein